MNKELNELLGEQTINEDKAHVSFNDHSIDIELIDEDVALKQR